MLKNIEYTSDKIFFFFKRTCDKEFFSFLNEQSVILNIHNIKRDSCFTLDWKNMPGTVKVNTKEQTAKGSKKEEQVSAALVKFIAVLYVS